MGTCKTRHRCRPLTRHIPGHRSIRYDPRVSISAGINQLGGTLGRLTCSRPKDSVEGAPRVGELQLCDSVRGAISR